MRVAETVGTLVPMQPLALLLLACSLALVAAMTVVVFGGFVPSADR
jgi:hypothetical protein